MPSSQGGMLAYIIMRSPGGWWLTMFMCGRLTPTNEMAVFRMSAAFDES